MASIQRLSVTCFLVTLVIVVSLAEEAQSPVSVEPSSVKEPTGRLVEISCTGPANATLQWQDANRNVISTNTSQRVHVKEDAKLTLVNVNVNDTGAYTCLTVDGLHNATATLEVYIMPNYFLEGMIILLINAGLIVIFFACLVHALIKSRRQKSKEKQAELKQAL